jgi:hypothetical protein
VMRAQRQLGIEVPHVMVMPRQLWLVMLKMMLTLLPRRLEFQPIHLAVVEVALFPHFFFYFFVHFINLSLYLENNFINLHLLKLFHLIRRSYDGNFHVLFLSFTNLNIKHKQLEMLWFQRLKKNKKSHI